jgi:type I restriction enzyme S subunit
LSERIKFHYSVVDERAGNHHLTLLSVSARYGVVPRDTIAEGPSRAEDLSNYKVCRPNDIVLNRMSAYQGAVGRATQVGIVSPDYMVIRPSNNIESRYLHHLFRSQWFVGQMTSRLRGIGSSDNGGVRTPRINPEDLGDIPVDLPSLDEQRRIADFLDAETAQINHLAELQQKARTSLEARTIAHLDLKIDELTEAYSTVPFRRMICSVEQGSSPQCDNFPAGAENWGVLKVSAVKNGRFWENENKHLPTEIPVERRYEIRNGDLLITRANTPQLVGAAAVARAPRKKLMLCDKIFRVVTTCDLLPDFLVFISLGTRIREMCAEASHGTSQSMANLKTEEIKRWLIPAAPLPVQEAAIKELSAAREQAAALTAAIDDQLMLLAERRQALITAAVTGEFDVTTAG